MDRSWRSRNGRNNNASSERERQARPTGGSWRRRSSAGSGAPQRGRPNWSNNSNGQQRSFRESAIQKRVFPSGRRRRGHAQSLVILLFVYCWGKLYNAATWVKHSCDLRMIQRIVQSYMFFVFVMIGWPTSVRALLKCCKANWWGQWCIDKSMHRLSCRDKTSAANKVIFLPMIVVDSSSFFKLLLLPVERHLSSSQISYG